MVTRVFWGSNTSENSPLENLSFLRPAHSSRTKNRRVFFNVRNCSSTVAFYDVLRPESYRSAANIDHDENKEAV